MVPPAFVISVWKKQYEKNTEIGVAPSRFTGVGKPGVANWEHREDSRGAGRVEGRRAALLCQCV